MLPFLCLVLEVNCEGLYTNQECLSLDPPCTSRLLCALNDGFPRLACQGLSASVSRMHAWHVESSLDLLMLRIHQKILTDPVVLSFTVIPLV